MQILVAVMMVTFISTMIPRAAVCAERIAEVLDTVVVGGAADARRWCRRGPRARSSCAASSTATPAPSCRC